MQQLGIESDEDEDNEEDKDEDEAAIIGERPFALIAVPMRIP